MARIDKTYIKSYEQYREIADWCKAQGTVIDTFGNTITPYDYIPHLWDFVDKGEYTEDYVNEWLDYIRKDNDKKYNTEAYWKKCCKLYADEGYVEKYPTLEKWGEYVNTWAEIPLWNTDHVFDIYLIKNCPVQFIQDRLKEQYGGGWSKEAFTENDNSYEAIKNGTSVYDTYQRNGLKKPHFKIKYKLNVPFKDNNIDWWIEVYVGKDVWDYDNVADKWYSYNECYMPKCDSWTSVCNFKYYGNMSKGRIYRILKKWNLPEGTTVSFRGFYKRHLIKHFNITLKK